MPGCRKRRIRSRKLTWDNAALLSPGTAKKLGVVMGDVISIERDGRKVEGPVMVQPGQADDTVVIAVGYGRTKVGQVGEGTGFNAYKIRTFDSFGYGTGFNVTKTGRTYPLARTQEFDYQEEPKLASFQQEAFVDRLFAKLPSRNSRESRISPTRWWSIRHFIRSTAITTTRRASSGRWQSI